VGNVSPETAQRIKQIVLDCSIRRLTSLETAEYLKQQCSIDVDVRTVNRYKARIRDSAQDWVANLAKNRRGEYIAQYRERIFEILAYQQKLWTIASSDRNHDRTKVEAIHELLQCTQQLAAFYDSLPLVNAIREYDNGSGGNNNSEFIIGDGGNGGSCNRYCAGFDNEENHYRCDLHDQEFQLNKHPPGLPSSYHQQDELR